MGPALPIVAGLFLAYCLFGHWLPAPLDHRGYTLEQVVEHMAFGTEGIYGTPTLVSATYIFLFILFGAFMEKAGVIDFFNDISMAAFGGTQGGPGKVCVASSALMGTVSGLRRRQRGRLGPVHHSADEALRLHRRPSPAASRRPPRWAARSCRRSWARSPSSWPRPSTCLIRRSSRRRSFPAMLYFAACYLAVHLEAGKRGLKGLPRDELPNALDRD